MASEAVEAALIKKDLEYIKRQVDGINKKIESQYVTRIEFESRVNPIQKIVYGMVSIILVSVVGALISLVVLK